MLSSSFRGCAATSRRTVVARSTRSTTSSYASVSATRLRSSSIPTSTISSVEAGGSPCSASHSRPRSSTLPITPAIALSLPARLRRHEDLLRIDLALGAESATDVVSQNSHLVALQAQNRGDPVAYAEDPLGRGPDRELTSGGIHAGSRAARLHVAADHPPEPHAQ